MLQRLSTMRGQLVLWYLGALAVLLLGLGVLQTVALNGYLQSVTASSMRQSARADLAVLGPCFIRSDNDLGYNAQRLANVLGSPETGVKIVTPDGFTLADHGIGSPGSSRPLVLSAATIHQLIAALPADGTNPQVSTDSRHCLQPRPVPAPRNRRHHHVRPDRSVIGPNNLLLVAVPIGHAGNVLGYAILGRSLAEADATVRRVSIIFALGALGALLIAALIALPIINRALRPLRRVARTASAIAAGDLQNRANLAQSPDEIGRLGQAFDAMVDQLEAALSASTASEERMRRFLADASHELRTPLTALRGTSEVLLRQGAGGRPEVEQALRAMHEESVRLSRLVDDLLTLSRLDSGQQLNPQPITVGSFLEQFLNRYGHVWPDRPIVIAREELDGAAVAVDPDALTRVLTNLVDNAARYSTPGEPIDLVGRTNAATVQIQVRDRGPGLEPEDAKRVFERFYRGNKSRSRRSGGAGLGLSIVGALVEQSGGRIDMETGPDRGTTVTVSLPRLAPSRDA